MPPATLPPCPAELHAAVTAISQFLHDVLPLQFESFFLAPSP